MFEEPLLKLLGRRTNFQNFLISESLGKPGPRRKNLGNEKVKLFQRAPIRTIFCALERYVHGHYTSDSFKSRNCHLGLEF